ncbi:tetratricopeptide repeat protein [Actinoallomurus sp. NPDC050550]|uniref:AfsR/SARP family transcriptional regulator n=1 Tax=Actinoallomurus sp. NPDC050550 TaxID=3154937 RepID=UPI0033E31E16
MERSAVMSYVSITMGVTNVRGEFGGGDEEPADVVVLGPVGIERAGTLVRPSSGVSRALLGALALSGTSGLSASALSETVWGERGTSGSLLGVAVYRLRRWLADVAGTAVTVRRTTMGYALEVVRGDVDVAVFRRLTAEAATVDAPGRLDALERGLDLWRGDALEDVSPDSVDHAAVARLLRERAAATVEYARVALEAGAPRRALDRIGPLIERHRLDERLLAVWIEALACCGRQAEALEAYEEARGRLRDQLGVDPGPELRDAHVRVLRQEMPSAPAPEAVRPDQVPAAIGDFTGRADHVKRMLDLLSADHRAVVVSAVAGMGGVGKTTLATYVAHHLREGFPDGRLYVDLRGAEQEPADPGEVLGRFLRALGVGPAAIPEGLGERAALYRSMVADRRMLIVLDNASEEQQVAPLLPGGEGCRVIVTSRSRLTALPGVRLIELDVLDHGQAVDLLSRIIGAPRVTTEPDAVERLASICGGLPLALRVAGARLAAKPHWRIADFVARLADRRRLDELTHRGLSVRAALDLSYDGLDPAGRRLYRLLGLLEAPDFAGWVAAAVLDTSLSEGTEVLEQLIDARLLDVTVHSPGDDVRYHFHDLVRDHARERCLAEDPVSEGEAAVLRALGGWLALTDRGVHTVNGGGNTTTVGDATRFPVDEIADRVVERPAEWLERERIGLTAAVGHAARLGEGELCWELAVRSSILFQPAHYVDAWQQVVDVALPATRTSGNRRGEAAVLERLAELCSARRDYDRALDALRQALRIFEATEDAHGTGRVLRQLAVVHRMTGRFSEALRDGERACALLQKVGDAAGRAHALMVIGCVHHERGNAETALSVLTTARAVARDARYTNIEVQSAYWIGQALLALGRHHDARSLFEYVNDASAAAGSRLGDMYANHGLGCAYAALGRPDDAERSLRTALRRAEERDDRLMRARILYLLGDLRHRRGEHRHARGLLEKALELADAVSVPLWKARCLLLLGDIIDATGVEEDAARAFHREGLSIFTELGVPLPQEIVQRENAGHAE